MRRIVAIFSSVVVLSLGLYGCNDSVGNTEDQETTYDMAGAISQMESAAIKESKTISVATNMDEDGKLVDFIDVSVEESYIEKEKITKASLEPLKNTPDVFVDQKGNLKEGYSFVGVKMNIGSEKDLKINISSFKIRGIANGEYLSAECFYQDGKNISDNVHDIGMAEIKKGNRTEITLGFFADEEMMKSEKFYLVPEFFDIGEDQGNYIELALDKEK